MTLTGATREGIYELIGHDPYTCPSDCCASHETPYCQKCGNPSPEGLIVAYVLGCEIGEAHPGRGPWTQPDKWVTLCCPCEDASGWT